MVKGRLHSVTLIEMKSRGAKPSMLCFKLLLLSISSNFRLWFSKSFLVHWYKLSVIWLYCIEVLSTVCYESVCWVLLEKLKSLKRCLRIGCKRSETFLFVLWLSSDYKILKLCAWKEDVGFNFWIRTSIYCCVNLSPSFLSPFFYSMRVSV